MATRPSLPKDIETQVLVKSRRRCCLCAFIDRDLHEKRVQIAHIDRDRNNHRPDNLVALCIDHHDIYDSRTSQSKGVTVGEVKHFRNELYKINEKLDEQILLPSVEMLKPAESASFAYSRTSARLIGEIISIYDKQVESFKIPGRNPIGIGLGNLARTAIQEDDFDAAEEAVMFLLYLAVMQQLKQESELSRWRPGQVPTASAFNELIRTLHYIMGVDSSLFRRVLGRMRQYAMIGNEQFDPMRSRTNMPDPSCYTVVCAMCALSWLMDDRESHWYMHAVSELLMDILLSLGTILVELGVGLPDPPSIVTINGMGVRVVAPDLPQEWKTFIQSCNAVAQLPEYAFKSLISNQYRVVFVFYAVDDGSHYDEESVANAIRGWSFWPGNQVLFTPVLRDEDIPRYEKKLASVQSIGREVAQKVKDFLYAERRLIGPKLS